MPAAQLSLLDFDRPAPPKREPDLVDALLYAHRGDYRKAISELLLDADFLREQLATASRLMSAGMGRSWRPRYERI